MGFNAENRGTIGGPSLELDSRDRDSDGGDSRENLGGTLERTIPGHKLEESHFCH